MEPTTITTTDMGGGVTSYTMPRNVVGPIVRVTTPKGVRLMFEVFRVIAWDTGCCLYGYRVNRDGVVIGGYRPLPVSTRIESA